ncbi:conserved hypothetical protein [Leishmania major strain Friedlin]|uniref:Transmembrane protein n=1 Tax=Leishmania major TaxID=5664 RepID=Q4QFC5_LEIMA|nr:conserved hypothetical protein [Leishmania major strain Friedlin]CAG9571407.1 hypothetical_protein_-_conserved [Leishmania major strain Friedlin]CAJ03284.1 conserved hypothetical protein [Leishmania major strain Friedlin]|eukprot:XP_001681973.1 conserved hypothetical protein [Leishmania major strain Friedlin]
MSLLRVTQCLTADGKVQIDVTNISGRTQYPPSQDPPNSLQPSSSKDHRARGIPDRDEPCSLIVSLRSSHPQFFYYRGPQHKQLSFSTSVASHLYAPPPGSASSAGVGGCGNNNKHQRSPSSLWGPRVVDPVIEDVSQQAWKDLGFSPVAAPAAGTVKSSVPTAEATSSVVGKSSNGGGGDDRPLLVREELADCVLLPGERRTFLLEVDTPSVLQRLMAPLAQQKARITSVPALQGNARAQDSCPLPALGDSPTPLGGHSKNTGNKPQPRTAHTHGSEDGTNITISESTPRATEVFHLSRCESSRMGSEPNPTLFPAASRTAAKDAKSVSGDRQQQQRAVSKRGSGPLQSSRSRSSSGEMSDCNSHSCNPVAQLNKTRHPTRQRTMPWGADDEGDCNGDAAGQTPPGNGRRNRRPHEKCDMSDTEDDDERSASPQPLSIVQDSMTTRESLDASRLSAATAPGAPRPGPSGGTAHDPRLTSRDFTVPSSINTTAASTPFLAKANREDSGKPNTHPHVAAAGSGATRTLSDGNVNEAANPANGSKDRAQRWLPPASTSQRPTFYVYYAPLGDENKCVDEARKWLLKEQRAYRQWLDKLVRVIVNLERKREQEWIRTSNNSVRSPHRPLGARRVLPPILGELVRWRSGDGGSGSVIDVMAPSPITAAAFQYYYGNLPLQKIVSRPLSQLSVRGNNIRHSWMGGGSGSGSNSNAGGGCDKEAVLVLPSSFAATRHNRVSAKARKMFKEERHGAGTVVLPLRVKPQSATQPSPKPGFGNGGAVSAATATHPSPSSSQTSEEVCNLSRKSSEPPYSRVWAPMSSPWQLRSYQATSPPHYTMENSSELGDYRGSGTPMSESPRTETGYERPRFKSGCGLALLEDSAATLPTFSRNSLADGMSVLPSKTDNAGTPMDLQENFPSPGSSKMNRTETLDPVAAEMAAAGPPTSRWSSLSGIYGQMYRGFSDSPLQQRLRLPSSPSVGDMASPDSRIPSSSSTGVGGTGAASQGAARLSYNSPPPSSGAPGNARSADDSAAASSAATAVGLSESTPTTTTSSNGALTATVPAGSFATQLLQSLYGHGGSAKSDVDKEGNAAPHMRDISSAPPQTLAYRHRSTAVSNSNSFTGSMFGSSFSMRPQERLNRIADQSMAAGSQVKAAVQQLTATTSDLVQQHGPPAVSGLMSLLNFLKDTIFTPENVGMIQMVVAPMVMACSVLVVVYLILSVEGSGSDVFSLIDGRGL